MSEGRTILVYSFENGLGNPKRWFLDVSTEMLQRLLKEFPHPEGDAASLSPSDVSERLYQRRYWAGPSTGVHLNFHMTENIFAVRESCDWERRMIAEGVRWWLNGASIADDGISDACNAAHRTTSHHYLFQEAVRRFAFEKSEGMCDRLSMPDGVTSLWRIVGHFLPVYERVPADGLECEVEWVDENRLAVFMSLPTCCFVADARYLAILMEVVDLPGEADKPPVKTFRCAGIWSYQFDWHDKETGNRFTLHFLPDKQSTFYFQEAGKAWVINDFAEFMGIIEGML